QNDAVQHRHTEYRNESNGGRHREVLTGYEQRYEAAYRGKRHVRDDQSCEFHRVERGVQQHEDEEDRQRYDDGEPCKCALLVLERTAPFDPVARWQVELFLDRAIGIL